MVTAASAVVDEDLTDSSGFARERSYTIYRWDLKEAAGRQIYMMMVISNLSSVAGLLDVANKGPPTLELIMLRDPSTTPRETCSKSCPTEFESWFEHQEGLVHTQILRFWGLSH